MKKMLIPFLALPLFLVGCGKDKNVYASSKNTIFKFKTEDNSVVITGLNSNYRNQTDIIIPRSIDKLDVKRIEDNSFEGVYRLKNVDMSKSRLTEIGKCSFKECSNLVNVSYPNTITKIDNNAFEECSNLVKMDLSNCALEEISETMFLKCSSLTEVKFPKTVKTLGSNIFSGCTSITELDFSTLEIEKLNDYALANIENLKEVKLSPTTKELGAYSLAENKKVQFYNFSNTQIETIKEGAFSNCRIVANISLPNKLKSLDKKAFYYCTKLSKMDLSKTALEEIPESCFELCSALDSVKLPSVKTISGKAFYNSSLRTINIPSSVTNIADNSFRLCKKLESITVSADNTSYVIHNDALYTSNKEKLIVYPAANARTEFVISEQTKVINPYAFAEAVNLETVNLESTEIEEIGDYTFMNCTSLKTITFIDNAEKGVKRIGVKAFFGCKALTRFDAMYSVAEIGESAFYDCINLKDIILGKSNQLTKIDDEAFYNCNKLENLTLPGSITKIGRSAFYNCEEIKSIVVGANSTYFKNLLDNSQDCGLNKYILPDYSSVVHYGG